MDRVEKFNNFKKYAEERHPYPDSTFGLIATLAYMSGYLYSKLTDEQVESLPNPGDKL